MIEGDLVVVFVLVKHKTKRLSSYTMKMKISFSSNQICQYIIPLFICILRNALDKVRKLYKVKVILVIIID